MKKKDGYTHNSKYYGFRAVQEDQDVMLWLIKDMQEELEKTSFADGVEVNPTFVFKIALRELKKQREAKKKG